MSDLLRQLGDPGFQQGKFLGKGGLFLEDGQSRCGCIASLDLSRRVRRHDHWLRRKLERTIMGSGQLLDLLGSQTLNASISGMRGEFQRVLFEPLAQGFGMNAQQTGTVC